MPFNYDHYINSDEGGKNIILRELFQRVEDIERQLKGGVPEPLKVLESKEIRRVKLLEPK